MTRRADVFRALLPYITVRRATLPLIVSLGLVSYALEGAGLYLFLPLLSVMQDGGESELPAVVQRAVASLPATHRLPLMLAIVMAAVLLKNVVAFLNGAYFAAIDAETSHRMRCDLHESILRAGPDYLDSQPAGRLANTLLAETWRAARAPSLLFTLIVDCCAMLVFSLLLMLVSWKAALIVAPVLLCIAAALHLTTRGLRPLGAQAVAASEAYTTRAWESLNGLNTLRVFDRTEFEAGRLTAISQTVREKLYRVQLIHARTPQLFETVVALAVGLAILMLAQAGFSMPTVAVFLMVLYRMQPRVRSLIASRGALLELSAAVMEVQRLSDECRAARAPDSNGVFAGLEQSIRFDSVSLRYPNADADALMALDLEIRKNTMVAFVGPSGAGKSSIIELLNKNRVPSAGRILVDGIDLRTCARGEWFKRVAVVPQEIFLFDASVAENIAYGSPGAGREEVLQAAQLASAHEFIEELPAGYETKVGDRGVRLSGGQRQRIAIARALLKRPEILLIDEATNALDGHSEELIRASIERLVKSMTVVTVAHRLSTIRAADNIVVINRGRVVEQGTYTELVSRGGLFAAMVRLQSLQS